MKDIGLKLKEKREANGVSIEEAAEDLKVDPQILENLETGNKEAFRDVLYLKYYIKDYSKYLGLNYDEMVEEFNEYLFDYTSKISLEDIKNASKNQNTVKKEISSPYTIERKQQHSIPMFLIYILSALLIAIIIYCVVLFINKNDKNNNVISYNMEESYEFA